MTKARDILRDALTFHLNRLSPGEAMDADLFARGLDALNSIADEWNGKKAFLWQVFLTASASPVSASSGTLGTTWANLASGDEILGATAAYSTGLDVPLDQITMEQYHDIALKNVSSLPEMFAHDGALTVYFYPVPTGQTITLRTRKIVQTFSDLDTDYVMPAGYRAALAACVAELLAPTLSPALAATCSRKASLARQRMALQNIEPAIVHSREVGVGQVVRIKRGY